MRSIMKEQKRELEKYQTDLDNYGNLSAEKNLMAKELDEKQQEIEKAKNQMIALENEARMVIEQKEQEINVMKNQIIAMVNDARMIMEQFNQLLSQQQANEQYKNDLVNYKNSLDEEKARIVKMQSDLDLQKEEIDWQRMDLYQVKKSFIQMETATPYMEMGKAEDKEEDICSY